MKIYQDVKEIPEYNQAQAEFERFLTVLGETDAMFNKNIEFMIGALNRLQDEKVQAEQTLDKARAKLVAEEMHGKSSNETAKKVNATMAEIERIETTIEAFARSGGMTLNLLEKQISILNIKKNELENAIKYYEKHPLYGSFIGWSQTEQEKNIKSREK